VGTLFIYTELGNCWWNRNPTIPEALVRACTGVPCNPYLWHRATHAAMPFVKVPVCLILVQMHLCRLKCRSTRRCPLSDFFCNSKRPGKRFISSSGLWSYYGVTFHLLCPPATVLWDNILQIYGKMPIPMKRLPAPPVALASNDQPSSKHHGLRHTQRLAICVLWWRYEWCRISVRNLIYFINVCYTILRHRKLDVTYTRIMELFPQLTYICKVVLR
jgi:hypothetical protein